MLERLQTTSENMYRVITQTTTEPGFFSKKRTHYYKNFATFDIEVTKAMKGDVHFGIPYLWTLCVKDGSYFYGRTIDEFVAYIYELNKKIEARLVIYVHNLSYEFQFICKYFEWDDVFLTGKRDCLYAIWENIEFRCSYKLTAMSLGKFLEENNVENLKLDYDYNVNRYPWTKLSDYDYEYCAHDTVGLYEALNHKMGIEGSNVANIPLTSTGYVRRDVKNVQGKKTRSMVRYINDMDDELYIAMKSAFMGGNTHANRFFTNKILSDVYCYDITSSYPFVQVSLKFPIAKFRKLQKIDICHLHKDFAYLLKLHFDNIRLKDPCDPMPQISISKCIDKHGYHLDNGRVLDAGSLDLWGTDVEFKIIQSHYEWDDIVAEEGYYSRYGYLPTEICSVIYRYFKQKCDYKGVDPYMYKQTKKLLNAIFGMSAFDIGKRRFSYIDGDFLKDGRELNEILGEMTGKSAAEPYAWGVWTTANARYCLDEVIRLTGDRFVYCDTDSVYCLDKLDLTEINNRKRKESEKYHVGYNYLGVWEDDKYCKKFKTLGSKKYCYVDGDDEIHVVTAGVGKKAKENFKSIDDYNVGYVFKGATSKSWYEDEGVDYCIDGHKGYIPSSIYIEDGDYTLGITEEYNALLYAIKGDEFYEQVFYE